MTRAHRRNPRCSWGCSAPKTLETSAGGRERCGGRHGGGSTKPAECSTCSLLRLSECMLLLLLHGCAEIECGLRCGAVDLLHWSNESTEPACLQLLWLVSAESEWLLLLLRLECGSESSKLRLLLVCCSKMKAGGHRGCLSGTESATISLREFVESTA